MSDKAIAQAKAQIDEYNVQILQFLNDNGKS